MCNPRSLNENSDDELNVSSQSLFDVSKLALKAAPSSSSSSSSDVTTTITKKIPRARSGRKGDPRMHKALEIRLGNPKLSLLDSLTKGGFEFHKVDNVWYDRDNISLSQRKNQLSRRVRLFKLNQSKQAEDTSVPGEQKSVEKPPVKIKEARKSKSTKARDGLKRCTGLHTQSSTKKRKLAVDSEAAMTESCSATVVVSSAFQNGAPIPATIASSEVNSVHETGFATSKNESEDSESRSENNEGIDQAVNLYLKKSSDLMAFCLESVGFSKEECKKGGRTFSKFFGRVVDCESQRLKKMRSLSIDNIVSDTSLNLSQDEGTEAPHTLQGDSSSQEVFSSSYAFAADGNDQRQVHPVTNTSNAVTSKGFIESMNFSALQKMQHPVSSSAFYPHMNNAVNSTFNSSNYAQNAQWDVTSNNYLRSSGAWCITNQPSIGTNTYNDERMIPSLSYNLHDNDLFKRQDAMVSIAKELFPFLSSQNSTHFIPLIIFLCSIFFRN